MLLLLSAAFNLVNAVGQFRIIILGSEAEGSKTKERNFSSMKLKVISFVFYLLESNMNYDNSNWPI